MPRNVRVMLMAHAVCVWVRYRTHAPMWVQHMGVGAGSVTLTPQPPQPLIQAALWTPKTPEIYLRPPQGTLGPLGTPGTLLEPCCAFFWPVFLACFWPVSGLFLAVSGLFLPCFGLLGMGRDG